MSRSVRYVEQSRPAAGTATAPTANTAVATLAAPSKGKYEVVVYAGVSNAAVGDLGNLELRRGGTDLVSPIPCGASGQMAQIVIPRVDLDGTQNLTVNAIANATASIEYNAVIIATKVEG